MKLLKIISQVALIYLITILGELIQSRLHLPIPGSIVGLVLLFILLSCKIIPEKWILDGVNFLLSAMMLFFIPATVGIMNYFNIFHGKGLLLVLGIIVSSCLVMIFSGFVAEKMKTSHVEVKKG